MYGENCDIKNVFLASRRHILNSLLVSSVQSLTVNCGFYQKPGIMPGIGNRALQAVHQSKASG